MRWIAFFIGIGALAQTPAQTTATELDIAGKDSWVDTMLDVRPSDVLAISASGTMSVRNGKTTSKVTADGASRGFRDLLKSYPVNEAGQGALIGRIGSSETATPFLVGSNKSWTSPRAGRLFLGINKTGNDAPDGTFHVKIEFTSRGPEVSTAPKDTLPSKVTVEIVDRIPRRVVDAQGNAGDNTNFVVVGDEKKVLAAFEAAGWVKVDKAKEDAVIHGLLSILNKEAYVELPMSELTLFGRVQDYGLAHAEPIAVVMQRHHLRLWKAPFKVDDQELWVGAATHDIGFDRDQRNNGVTHKIDPDVDLEREFVKESLDDTGLVASLTYVAPSQPSKEARTATGATFHSDGRMLVIQLR
ncbi:MAG: LssY C-terminal domain-containing protein [Acidobacteriia bacterium]|nr:LssY C-terminal domain-containing protein [Terriglobia bacterium]